MHIAHTIPELRRHRRRHAGSWGFVPTMGYLHAGHLALVERARQDNDHVAVSLFVNPTQFGDPADLIHYPREPERDLELLRQAGVDLVFAPEPEVLYPPGFQTYVSVEEVSRPLEGSSRPTHFRGVATVLTKLFHLVAPSRAYFGQKDAQQTIVVRRLVEDLDFDLEIVVCPTVREADGLAMSSRNARLNADQRAAAPVVYRALQGAAAALRGGQRNAEALRAAMRATLESEPLALIDYVSVADPRTLEELERVEGEALLSLAAFFGKIRLIDNLLAPEFAENTASAENTGSAEGLDP
jgi:pantoate--beta-alanine ligase